MRSVAPRLPVKTRSEGGKLTELVGYWGRVAGVKRVFGFPNTVNETSARLVASGVVLQAVAFLGLGSGWVLFPLTYGFLARVLTGPTLSPLGQFVTQVVVAPVRWRAPPGGRPARSGSPRASVRAFTASGLGRRGCAAPTGRRTAC